MREKYESLSLATLKDLAKARGLKGISTLRKPELIDRMLQEDEREAAVQKETSPKTQESVQTEKAEEPVREQRNFDNPGERPVRQEFRARENRETAQLDSGEKANGILEVLPDGYGFIRCENYRRAKRYSMFHRLRFVDLI